MNARRCLGVALLALAPLLAGCGAGAQQGLYRATAACVLELADSGLGGLATLDEGLAAPLEVARVGIHAGQAALEAWELAEDDAPLPSWLSWAREAIGWVGGLIQALRGVGVPVPDWLVALANLAQAFGEAGEAADRGSEPPTAPEEILPEGVACPIP